MSEWDGETINTGMLEWTGYPECGDLDIDIKEESLDYGEELELESSHDRDLSANTKSIPGNLQSRNGSNGHLNRLSTTDGMNGSVESDSDVQEHFVDPEPSEHLAAVVSKNSRPRANELVTSRELHLLNIRLCELGCDYREKYVQNIDDDQKVSQPPPPRIRPIPSQMKYAPLTAIVDPGLNQFSQHIRPRLKRLIPQVAKQNTGVTRKAKSNNSELLGKKSFHSHHLRSHTQSALDDTLEEIAIQTQTLNSSIAAGMSGFEEETPESLTDDQENIGRNKVCISKPNSNPKSTKTDNSDSEGKMFSSRYKVRSRPKPDAHTEDERPEDVHETCQSINNNSKLEQTGERFENIQKKVVSLTSSSNTDNHSVDKAERSGPFEEKSCKKYGLRSRVTIANTGENPTIDKTCDENVTIRTSVKCPEIEMEIEPVELESIPDSVIPIGKKMDSTEKCEEKSCRTYNIGRPKSGYPTGENGLKCKKSSKVFEKKIGLLGNAKFRRGRKDKGKIPTVKKVKEFKRASRPLGSKEKPYKCRECPKTYTLKDTLAIHTRSHTGEGMHKCEEKECGKSYTRQHQLKVHSEVHAAIPSFECIFCARKLCSKYTLETHMRAHTGLRPFVCQECGKDFTSKSNLSTHMKSHGEGTFKCKTCNKRCNLKGQLTVHMRSHTGERPYKCALCPKSFKTSTHRKNHQVVHTGDLLFKCPECGKDFGSRSGLIDHKKTHNPVKLLECKKCHEMFRTNGQLKDHGISHSRKMPFKCDECGMRFKRLNALARHKVDKHTPGKSFLCELCGEGFSRSDALKKHKRRKHKRLIPSTAPSSISSKVLKEKKRKEGGG